MNLIEHANNSQESPDGEIELRKSIRRKRKEKTLEIKIWKKNRKKKKEEDILKKMQKEN